VAAKTVKNLLGRIDGKRRGFFLVKRTQPLEILAGSGQAHMVADYIGDINPVSDLVDDIVRNQASSH
jgi:hypothetical protein